MTTLRRALTTLFFLATMTAPAALAELVDLSVTKSGPATATAGSSVAYTVTVSNAGPDATVDTATLTDNIPEGMTFVSGVQNSGPTFTCDMPDVGEGGTISCTVGPFPAGATATFTFTFQIDVETPNGTTFTNVANISLPQRIVDNNVVVVDTNEENDTAIAITSTPPAPSADLAVFKSAPGAAAPGNDITYTITILNNGPAAATDVNVTDTLPGTLTFVSLTQTSGPAFSCSTPAVGTGGTITCTAATLASGTTATLTLVGNVPSDTPSGTTFDNTVNIASTDPGSFDPNEENNSSTTSTTISAVDVSVTKTGSATANAGSNLAYTITVSNAGPDFAVPVTLNDTLPAGTTFVSLTQQNGPFATCFAPAAGLNGSVQCTFNSFGSGSSATFTLTINVGGATSISNTATVTTESFDTNTGNNSSTANTTVTPQADLAVTKTGPATVERGANATYTIVATNNGPSTAVSVTLSDVVPAGTTFVSFGQTGGTPFSCSTPAVGGTGTITCTAGSLASGASATFTLTLAVGAGVTSPFDNTATISSATADPVAINNSGTASVNATLVDLAVTKSGPANATAGTDITYTINLINNGTINATNVTLTDVLPADTTFVSITPAPGFNCTTPAVGANGTVTCTAATFTTGLQASFTLVVRLRPGATASVVNTATATTSNVDPLPANNSATATTNAQTSADLAVTKSGAATVTAGQNLTYTITATNNGPSNATTVTITDVLPPNTTFVSATGGAGSNCTGPAVGANGTVTCTVSSLAPASTLNVTLVVATSPSATGSIANTATISAATTDPQSANNSSTTNAAVQTSADLSVTKSAPASIASGQNLSFTVVAANNGPSDASSVTLTDVMPANTTFVSATQSTGPTFICTTPAAGANGTISCSIASLPSTASATFTFVVGTSPSAVGPIANTATIAATTADPLTSNNSATSTTTAAPGATDLAIVKTSNVISQTAIVGSNVTFTLTVTNNGPSLATGTTVTDVLPAGLTATSATPSQGSCTGNTTVVCTLGNLASGANATITIGVTLPDTPSAYSNTATVSATNADTNPLNNSSTVTFNALRARDIPTLSPLALALLALGMAAVVLSLNRLQ